MLVFFLAGHNILGTLERKETLPLEGQVGGPEGNSLSNFGEFPYSRKGGEQVWRRRSAGSLEHSSLFG